VLFLSANRLKLRLLLNRLYVRVEGKHLWSYGVLFIAEHHLLIIVKNSLKKGRLLVICLSILMGSAACAYALIVSLDVYVEFGLLFPNDSPPPDYLPFPDGMTVMLIGSQDGINDGMDTWGGTNLIADSVNGDDQILAILTVSSNESGVAGGFFATLTYESDDVSFVYIRFFNAPPNALTGMIYWGTSTVYQLGVTLGVSTVNFSPETNLIADNYNNFVIIPEPSTANLFVMVAGMMWAMRSHMRRKSLTQSSDEDVTS